MTGYTAQAASMLRGDMQNNRRVAPKPQTVALSLPNTLLLTQDNKPVRLYDDLLKDKIFLINMFFITCTDGVCPRATANLAKVQSLIGSRLGRDIFMYSITLDAKRDTSKALKEYSSYFDVKPGWFFLTGEPGDIERLRRPLGFWDPDPKRDADKTSHAGIVVIGNERLDRWTACPALAEPREIRRVLTYLDRPKV